MANQEPASASIFGNSSMRVGTQGALSPAFPDPTDCSWVSEDEMGYGLCTSMHSSLELGMFLRRSYFFIIWRYDLFNVSGNRVRAVTACHSYPIFLEVPPGFFVVFYIQMGWGGGVIVPGVPCGDRGNRD